MGWRRFWGSAIGAGALLVLLATVAEGTANAAVSSGGPQLRDGGVVLRAGWQEHMLSRVNAVRAQAGVPPLRMCARLNASARAHALDMGSSGVFSHAGPAGDQLGDRLASAGYRMRAAGENIAAGQRAPWQVMKAWRGSPAHYAILTDPTFRHAGFAMATATAGPNRTYWVQHLAAGGRC